MGKLQMSIRGLFYMLWAMLYVGVASWVGEGQWDQNSARFMAAFLFFGAWLPVGAAIVEWGELPKQVATALLEDEA